jgi:hypothetical protein
MSRAPSNPFYAGESTAPASGTSNPPAYRASNRPVPATPAEPVSYTSLSDLTKGKQQKPNTNSFSYQPSSQRAGYREGGPVQSEPTGQGARRNLPPDPQAGRNKSLVPPQRNVAGQPDCNASCNHRELITRYESASNNSSSGWSIILAESTRLRPELSLGNGNECGRQAQKRCRQCSHSAEQGCSKSTCLSAILTSLTSRQWVDWRKLLVEPQNWQLKEPGS